MAYAVEDIGNMALREIGAQRRIANIYEGSEEAKALLEIYGEVRDALLRSEDWPFARRANVVLSLLKGPPPVGGYNPYTPWTTSYPPPPWLYEYVYPADCLEFRAIIRVPGMWPNYDPRPARWRVDYDGQRVVLSDVPNALANYCARVTNPAQWEPLFIQALVTALARRLATPLGKGQTPMKDQEPIEAAAAAMADVHRG